jgi:serine/threonine-protein kinase PknG
LAKALDSVNGVRLDPREHAELTAEILRRAFVEVGRTGPKYNIQLGPYRATEESLRDGLEATYRAMANVETDEARRYELVDQANAVRRWTLR